MCYSDGTKSLVYAKYMLTELYSSQSYLSTNVMIVHSTSKILVLTASILFFLFNTMYQNVLSFLTYAWSTMTAMTYYDYYGLKTGIVAYCSLPSKKSIN